MVNGFSEFFESVEVHSLKILAKKHHLLLLSLISKKEVDSHLKKELDKNDYVSGTTLLSIKTIYNTSGRQICVDPTNYKVTKIKM